MAKGARKYIEGQLGLFQPDSDWQMPSELPDLRNRPVVVLDCETKDQGLIDKQGPGWAFANRSGYLCGVSWAAEGSSGYAPILHPGSDTFQLQQVTQWVTDLAKSGTPLVFHSAAYDYGWLTRMGADLSQAKINDTLAACVLVDETEYNYGLDDCCHRIGLPGKDTQLLKDAVEAAGGDPKKARESIWRVEARFAAAYAEADAEQTLALWYATAPLLLEQDLTDAYETEMGLVPMTVAMRRRGIRLDLDGIERAKADFRALRDVALADVGELLELNRAASIEEIRSPKKMAQWFNQSHVNFPRTAKTQQGSFKKEWMEKDAHPLPRACALADQYEEAATKFLDNYLLSYERDGRIHAEIHQYRDTTGGTRSHRFSYSEPPLQQMPSPDKPGPMGEIGQKIRGCFLPEPGERWCSLDYSQQEPRLTVHFASRVGALGAETAVQRYLDEPRTDYHKMVAEMVDRPRSIAKILNLAMTYGKGKHSLAEELQVPVIEAEAMLADYHNRLPFIKSLEDKCRIAASTRGYIRLIDGARMHYPQWEGGYTGGADRAAAERDGHILTPTDLKTAQERQKDPNHPWAQTRLRRADTRKALNNLVQGSAARQTKRAMLAMWREGVVPLIQLHDEVGISTADRAVALRVQMIMVETTPLVVPTIVDLEVGPTWGEAKSEWLT
jgi:DNA polymerase I-like protein with 3'-5' exonuclease and polymerase domains